MKKVRMLSMFFAVCLLVAVLVFLLPAKVQATASGTCGDNLTWVLDDNGTLSIFGTGPMYEDRYYGQPWSGLTINKVVFSEGITTVAPYAFSGHIELKEVILPKTLERFDEFAFMDCTGLTEIIIPEGVTSIGHSAFFGCSKLTEVTIPDSVKTISTGAFTRCSNLESVTIGTGVERIDSSAFVPTNLKTVYISDMEAWCRIRFEDFSANPMYENVKLYLCDQLVTEVTIPEGITSLEYTFSGYKELTYVHMPESLKTIGNGTFSGCAKLEGIHISNSVTTIGEYAFDGCSALRDVYLSKNLKDMAFSAFGNCKSLTEITIPDGMKTIANAAFHGCDQLKTVTLPDGIEMVYGNAFADCVSLAVVNHKGTRADWEKITFEEGNEYLRYTKRTDGYTGCTHGWNSGVVTKNATCSASGQRNYTCTLCGATRTEKLPKLLHTWNTGAQTLTPTCKDEGEMTHKCTACQAVWTAAIPRLTTHTYSAAVEMQAPTCKAYGVMTEICNECGHMKNELLPVSNTHDYADGQCTVCNAEDPNYVPPTEPVTEDRGESDNLFTYLFGAILAALRMFFAIFGIII
ncbi:MAG: leucine-rich repeat domain-containing protein [Ruminococcaceae bacterium]|nr:leucine-rich repeat domain-containing protein [Oscillospiraceae bacterium]